MPKNLPTYSEHIIINPIKKGEELIDKYPLSSQTKNNQSKEDIMFNNKVKISAILALFVGLLFTANIANAQMQQASDSTALEGKVIDSQTQQPVSGIELTVKGTEKTAQTNQQGEFSISGLEPGTYTLTATPDGYQEVSVEVELTSSGVKLDPTEDTFTIKLETSNQTDNETSYNK